MMPIYIVGQSEARKSRHTIPACSRSQSQIRKARHATPACSSLDKLSQHAVGQSEARKSRHTIPACSRSQSQIRKARHAIPAYTVQTHYPSIHRKNLACIKEAAKSQNSGQADTATSCTTRSTRVAAAEGQPAETLDHIQHELQNLLIAIHQPQPPAPAEPLREVLFQYTDTLFSTLKQSNLTNSLMQDIPVFN